MKHISIPIAPISFKILSTLYGGLPVAPPRKDMLYQHLWYSAPDHRRQTDLIHKLLTHRIELEVPNDLAAHLEDHGFEVGYHLYCHHVNELCKFAFAQTKVGSTAMGAIRNFLSLHNITEDDFPIDTAYKRWQRYILALKRRLDCKPETQKQVLSCNLKKAKIPKRGTKLDLAIAKVVRKNIHEFLLRDGRPNYDRLKKAIIYYQHELGAYPIDSLCRKHKLAPRTVYHHIATFRDLIHQEAIHTL